MKEGLTFGVVIGIAIGVATDNLGLWISLGVAIGAVVGKVNISKTTYNFIADDPAFVFEKRGEIDVKGKGLLEMFFVGLKDRA